MLMTDPQARSARSLASPNSSSGRVFVADICVSTTLKALDAFAKRTLDYPRQPDDGKTSEDDETSDYTHCQQ